MVETVTGWAGLFLVQDVSRSANPERIAIVTSNGRFFDFPLESAIMVPLPGDLILHAVCDVTEYRVSRSLYIVEIEEEQDLWYVNPKFSVWTDEIPQKHLGSLVVVDYTGQQRKLAVRL